MDLKEILGEELAAQVAEKLGDKKVILNDGTYIPKAKFDEINTAKNDYKAQLGERDKQLEELKKKATGNEDLTKQLSDLQEANQKAIDEYESKLTRQELDFAIKEAISGAKGKNVKAVKALLDLDKVEFKGDGLSGLSEQLEALKKSDPYLFGDEKQENKGVNPPPKEKKTARDEYEAIKAEVRKNPNDRSLKQKLFLAKAQLKE